MKKNSDQRWSMIKAHFEREAKSFDKNFFKVAPFYKETIDALIGALPFPENKKIRVIDLGCGTGNITQALLKRYPQAQVTCIDLAEQMITMAKAKLSGFKNIKYWAGDVRDFPYQEKYDAVIGSLVLHHIEKKEKTSFYRKILNALASGGVFYTADIVLGSNDYLQKLYINRWKDFMRQNISEKQIAATLKKHKTEDTPSKLIDELSMLRSAGFKEIDVIWKQHYFCVYGGVNKK